MLRSIAKTGDKKNNTALTTTIEGPDGASISTDRKIPIITESIPITVATTAIVSGELTNLLDAAAGIINIEVINLSLIHISEPTRPY